MSKKGTAYYAIPDDRDDLSRGAYLMALRGVSMRDHPSYRQQILDLVLEQLDQGLWADCAERMFMNGLGVHDLIFIPYPTYPIFPVPMSSSESTPSLSEDQAIIEAANALIELAKLRVDLARAFRSAQSYRDVILKIVAEDGEHLSEEECQTVLDKNFAKTLKTLAESRCKVSQWHANSAGQCQLILNELTFMDEEISATLALEQS